MPVLLLLTALTPDALDGRFPLLGPELHLFPGALDTAPRTPLERDTIEALQLGSGAWFAFGRVTLSSQHTGYLAFDAERTTKLSVVERVKGKPPRVTDTLTVMPRFERLEGAYEKTSNAWLSVKDGLAELVMATFLLDFEREDPAIAGTKNITGQTASRWKLERGKFVEKGPVPAPGAIKR